MFFQDEPMWSASGLLDQQMLPAPYSAATDELPVTAAARRALEEERDRLRGEKLRHFPERLRLAREFGDPADNDEYLAIREEEAVIDARLAQLESILSRTQIVDSADPGDTVAIGSTVTVLDLNSRSAPQLRG